MSFGHNQLMLDLVHQVTPPAQQKERRHDEDSDQEQELVSSIHDTYWSNLHGGSAPLI